MMLYNPKVKVIHPKKKQQEHKLFSKASDEDIFFSSC